MTPRSVDIDKLLPPVEPGLDGDSNIHIPLGNNFTSFLLLQELNDWGEIDHILLYSSFMYIIFAFFI